MGLAFAPRQSLTKGRPSGQTPDVIRRSSSLGFVSAVAASAVAVAGFVSVGASSARAATVLNVDLATTIRPVTHAASGSLYGVLETQPADVTALIAPLHPFMFNNPAADVQQPIGDAIKVATRLAPVGGKVTIRLADWFPSWPYAFTNITDWFDKIGQTVSKRK